jgi:hypothetical protein
MTSLHIVHALPLGGVKEISREDVRNLDNTMRARGLPFMGAPGVHRSLADVYDWPA